MNNLFFGLSVAVTGMVIVFAGLAILIGCIKCLSIFAGNGGKKKAQRIETASQTPVAQETQLLRPVTSASQEGITPEVLAAITAAIASVWQGTGGFVVRHVKRVSNAPAWNRAGREEQTYSRF